MNKSLSSSELFLVASLLTILATIVFIAKVQSNAARSHLSEHPPQLPIPLTISGAVAKPGTYKIPYGTPLLEAVQKARPTRFADLTDPALSQPLNAPTSLAIPVLAHITIHITGALAEPLTLCLPPGTRLADLKSKIDLLPTSDVSFFRSRRYIRDQEIIIIPACEKTSS